MVKIAVFMLGTVLGVGTPAQAAITEKTPYYMCFAYTQDGMLFAGGDFNFRRAQKMIAANCSLPKKVTVVLLKTAMLRKNGKTFTYALRER